MANVLITGGSRGLGAALGKAFAERGDSVVLVARNGEELSAAVGAISGDVHGVVADVADKESTHRIAGEAVSKTGPIDVLVLNASSLGPLPMPLLLDTACEDLSAVFETNVVGHFRLLKAIVAPMILRGSGTVVAISSDAAANPYPHWGAYGASKAAFDHLLRVLAAEHPELNVLLVDPGEMDTQMHADAMPDADRATLAQPGLVAEKILAELQGVSGRRISI